MKNNEPFYICVMNACRKMGRRPQIGTYTYNIIKEEGIIKDLQSGIFNFDDYTDAQLHEVEGLGYAGIDILRLAWKQYRLQKEKQ